MPAVTVAVYKGGDLVSIKERPVRSLPGKKAQFGVAYRGRVYRLLPITDHGADARWRINLRNRSYARTRCPVATQFEPAGQEAGADQSTWYLEDSQYRRYLALDGSEQEVETVVDTLGDAGIEVINYGRSMRPAANGRMYDWFIRLSRARHQLLSRQSVAAALSSDAAPHSAPRRILRELERRGITLTTDGQTIFFRGAIGQVDDPLVEAVRAAKAEMVETLLDRGLAEGAGTSADAATEPRIDGEAVNAHLLEAFASGGWDEATLERLGDALADAKNVNAPDAAVDDHWRSAIAALGDFARAEIDSYEARVGASESELRSARQRAMDLERRLARRGSDPAGPPTKAATGMDTEQVERLRAENSALRARVKQAEAVAFECMEREEDRSATIDALEQSRAQLRDRLAQLGDGSVAMDTALDVLLPRVRFRLGSQDFLTRLRQPSAALRLLKELDDGDLTAGANVGGAPGWRELKFSTGVGDDGRLYYRVSDQALDVVVSDKGHQNRDIRRVRQL